MRNEEDISYYRGNSPLNQRFVHAFHGIRDAWQRDRNFRIHILVGLIVSSASVLLPLSAGERALLVTMIALVLTLEIVNSYFERLLDIVHPHFSEEVKHIKDTMAGAVLITSGSAVLVGTLLFSQQLLAFDAIFQQALTGIRTPQIVASALAITRIGDAWPVILISIFSCLALVWRRRFEEASFLAGAVATGSVVLGALKIILERGRPSGVELIEAGGYSFPSGHVFLSTILWLSLAFILSRKGSMRPYVWLLPAIIIPLIAFTRVVLAVHWFSDIAAGFLFGLFWVLLWYGINEQLFPHTRKKS